MDIQHVISHLKRERKQKKKNLRDSNIKTFFPKKEKKMRYNVKRKQRSRLEEPQLFWKLFDNAYKCNPKSHQLACFCFPHLD